jgi:hypothetical protein
MVAGSQTAHTGSHLFHRTGAVVPADDRQGHRQISRDQMLVGMTHAGRGQPDQHPAFAWWVELDRLHAPVRAP